MTDGGASGVHIAPSAEFGEVRMTQEQVISELSESGKPVRHSDLRLFSGLSRSDAASVVASWRGIPPERRRLALDRMIELSEDDVEMDFTGVFRACLRDADAGARERAARGLWDSDDRALVRPLIEMLLKDESRDARAAATVTLAKFAEMASEGKMSRRDGDRIREALFSAIEREADDVETRRRAIEAVACFNSDRVKALIQDAYADSDARLKRSAIYAMGKSSDEVWMPTVLREMRNPDPAMRFEATAACGMLGDESAVPHLANMLEDQDREVQLAAVRALGAVGGGAARMALARAVRNGDDAIEEAAEEALAELDFDEDPIGFRFQ